MKKKLNIGFLISLIGLVSGCATQVNKTPVIFPENKICAVIPFVNYSETPLAGESAASITFGVLKSKGYRVKNFFEIKDEDLSVKEIKELKKSLKEKGYTCIVGGYVNEWRYKTGIDGEPAVSVTIYIENPSTNSTLSTITLSSSSWGHKSISTLYQELLNGEVK
ncbi:hypothetical protein [Desulfurobacterium atlanticum]|uniref:Lipoprotein n=1 Tax=Desulfurobacterium atlanticum TaxID=240169 RepID=A0A238XVE6_9BACT|nr:hypothetical protein [Desulfurobacterium atlanticum]SNR62660.1 hypothetical protein SAMN06265340_101285 [Desulfurobacterium atlanticum]